MHSALAELRDLYAYNRWANRRILAAVAAVPADEAARDLGSSFPSLLATLSHVLSAEWIWLERWKGRSPAGFPDAGALASLPDLTRWWQTVEREQTGFLDHLLPSDLDEILEYRNTAGARFHAPLWQLMRHLVNHSTYHRGQVVTMLRQLGAAAPSTDLVLFHRELLDAATPASPIPAPA
jgi:uncharacterized damage-inducible protein DinB